MPTQNKNFRVKNGIDAEGTITGTALAITGGTASQFLKANGTTDSSTYLTTGTASSTYLPLVGGTLTGQLISTRANNTGDGLGQIYLNGATGNRIDFNQNGVASPAFTTRSVGTKIVLYPSISASAADYALGIDGSTLWFGVPSTSQQFKWYGGTTQIASLTGAGAFSAVTKSFDIEHPTKENMRLRYGSLEGPENGVYVRGKSTKKTIKLPDYWKGLVDKDSITVQLTSIGSGTIYVDSIKGNSVKVGGTSEEFFYLIQAERKDVDKLIVEY